MKFMILLFALMVSLSAQAGNYACGADGLKTDSHRRAFTFLDSIKGSYQLGRCLIELQICDAAQPLEEGSVIGDLTVTDRFGRRWYVSFDFATVNTANVKTVVINGRRMVHYEFLEHLPDESSGRTEAYRLEILKSEDLTTLEHVELGTYTSRLRKEHPHLRPGHSYWAICDR
jgi:hypothetical protein